MIDNVALKYAAMWLAHMTDNAKPYPMCNKLFEGQKSYIRAAIARGKMTANAAKRGDHMEEYNEKELFRRQKLLATHEHLGSDTMDAIFGMAYWWAYSKTN